jgi:opacity protein-like surface antigen
MRKIMLAIIATLAVASSAAAQDYKPFDIAFGFGWAFPTTDFKNSFDAGWNGMIGGTFNFNEHWGFEADYTYARMNGPSKTVSITSNPIAGAVTNGVIDSNHQMNVGSFNALWRTQSKHRPIGGYLLGGGGIYHRSIQLTSPAVGYTTVCDPYWYVCYPTAVSMDQILGDRSSNDFGIDFGGGVTFGHDVKFFVESRYHYVWGPEVTNAVATPASGSTQTSCSSGCTTNAAYFPLTFGVKW